MENEYPIFLFITIILFVIRWTINWRIINNQNQTNYSIFFSQHQRHNPLGLLNHTITSQWTLYWKNGDKILLKKISNILSALTFATLVWTLHAFNKYQEMLSGHN